MHGADPHRRRPGAKRRTRQASRCRPGLDPSLTTSSAHPGRRGRLPPRGRPPVHTSRSCSRERTGLCPGTQTTWNGYLTTLAATRAWGLGDDGTTAFTGTVPNVTPAACAFVDVTVGVSGASATCAAPPAGSACGAPSGATTLASLGATTAFGLLPTPAQALTVTVTIARDTTNTVGSSPYAAGLHLTSSMALLVTSRAFSATLTWPSENVVL